MDELLSTLIAQQLAAGDKARPWEEMSAHDRIVRAALELFAEYSYEGATTKAIAKRANVTERTLFKHFPSKEQLFASTVFPALLQVLAPVAIQPFADLLDANVDSFEATLRSLVAERIAFAKRNPAIIAMAVREITLRPDFRKTITDYFDEWVRPRHEAVMARARINGQIQNLSTEVALRAIAGQLLAYLVLRVIWAPERQWDDEAEVDQIVMLIMHGIGMPKPEN